MPFPRKLLNDDETIAVDLHPHWFHFAWPVTVLVVGLVFGGLALSLEDGTVNDVVRWVALAAIVVGILWVVQAYVTWRTAHFVITSDRIIYRSGFIVKNGVDIPLERVNNVIFRQRLLERIFGAGDLLIESAGESGQQRFSDIRHPDKIQKLIYSQINLNEERGRMPAGTDAATQLEKLEGMLERGTLTREEFDAQKRKLLGT
jgi:uncharacterized membrane protein YdbT with pleckstrin-like domain